MNVNTILDMAIIFGMVGGLVITNMINHRTFTWIELKVRWASKPGRRLADHLGHLGARPEIASRQAEAGVQTTRGHERLSLVPRL